MNAKELMSKNPFCLKMDQKVRDAADIFFDQKLKIVPVVDDENRPIGILTQMSVLKALIHSYAKGEKPVHLSELKSLFIDPTIVNETATSEEVYQGLVSARSDRILVVDANQKLCGVISPTDLIGLLTHKDKKSLASVPQLKSYIRSLESNLNHLREYFDGLPFAVFALDFQNQISAVNKLTSEILSFEPSELIGKSILELVVEADHEPLNRILRYLHDNKYVAEFNCRFKDSRGLEWNMILQGSAFRAEDQMIEKLILIRHNDINAFLPFLNQ